MGAVAAMADALLGSVGGRQVLLRIPAPAIAGDLGEQLGLAQPEYQDVTLGPVVFRKVAGRELLVSGSALQAIVGSVQFGSAELLFASAAGLLIDGTFFEIESVASAEAFGVVYLYRVLLRQPAL